MSKKFPRHEGWERVRIETRGKPITRDQAIRIAANCQEDEIDHYEVGEYVKRERDVKIILRRKSDAA